MAQNQSQWPAQYPRYVPPAAPPIPPGAYWVASGHPQFPGVYPAGINPSMRAAHVDRDRAVDVLKAAFAEGRLTQDEFNQRMGRACEAKTYADLVALTWDLPYGPQPAPAPVGAGYRAPAPTNLMAAAALAFGLAGFFTFGLTSIAAIVCGHLARRQMIGTALRGTGLAAAGLVLGYLVILIRLIALAKFLTI